MKRSPFVIFTLLTIADLALTSRILFLLPVASKSHINVFEPLVRALGERGHEVVSLTPQPCKNMPPTVKEIVVVPLDEIMAEFVDTFKLRTYSNKFLRLFHFRSDYIEKTCKKVLPSQELKEIMTGEKFDLIVVDILMNNCMLGVVSELRVPYIYISTMAVPAQSVSPMGQRSPPSFVPSSFLDYSDDMTFSERFVNTAFNLMFDFLVNVFYYPKIKGLIKDAMGVEVDLYEIDKNISMMLVNSHFTMSHPRPYLPSVVDVGGMHLYSIKKADKLSEDLENFISDAEHGCIFFSLGSIIKGKEMPERVRETFVSVFGRLQQRVLWKWDSDTMADLPENVKLAAWFPQQAILEHNNTKLFISHGGLLSTQEAVFYGVPILGIPIFADQDLNIRQASNLGFALSIEIMDMTEEILEQSIKEMISNPMYETKAKELSTVWRDQPKNPLETAVYWTEYVIRNKGAPHLKSAARDLNFWQYYCLDVAACFFAVISICVFLIATCLKFTLKCLFRILLRKNLEKKTQ